MRYSLSDYILSIEPGDNELKEAFGTITIGGEGSYVGSVRASQTNDLFTTKGYATGDWVHNKNMDRTGTVEISLNQLAEKVGVLMRLINYYFLGDYDGATISIVDKSGKHVCSASDCYPAKPADQDFGAEAADQTWTFTCGKVTFGE
jgi:hypothetical protein